MSAGTTECVWKWGQTFGSLGRITSASACLFISPSHTFPFSNYKSQFFSKCLINGVKILCLTPVKKWGSIGPLDPTLLGLCMSVSYKSTTTLLVYLSPLTNFAWIFLFNRGRSSFGSYFSPIDKLADIGFLFIVFQELLAVAFCLGAYILTIFSPIGGVANRIWFRRQTDWSWCAMDYGALWMFCVYIYIYIYIEPFWSWHRFSAGEQSNSASAARWKESDLTNMIFRPMFAFKIC